MNATVNTNVLHTVDIGPVSISPSLPVTIASADNFNVKCSFDVAYNHHLPNTKIEWFSSPENGTIQTITQIETINNDTRSYTSTLQLSSVQESDAGIYTCRLEGNERISASIQISIRLSSTLLSN